MGEGFLGVVLGGLIAMLSGIISPTVQHFLGKRAREEDARRVNQISLITDIHEFEAWADRLQDHFLFGGEKPSGISPMAKIEAMILTHFPEAKLALAELQSRFASHRIWMIDQGKERLKGNVVNVDNYKVTFQPFSLAQANLIRAISGQVALVVEYG